MHIRLAVLEDALEIARIHIESWQSAYKNIIDHHILAALNLEQRTAGWIKILNQPDSWGFVALDRHKIIGFVHYSASGETDLPSDIGEIIAIYLSPDDVKKGIGATLLTLAINHLKQQRYSKQVYGYSKKI